MGRDALTVTTAEELWEFSHTGRRCELVEGRTRLMEPAGFEHGRIVATAGLLLGVHVRQTGIGVTIGAETGFVLASDPDTVRAPDAAFVTAARADAVGRTDKYWPGAPDFAIEVASPNDRPGELEAKAIGWVAAGTTAVLVLDPTTRLATIYCADGEPRVFAGRQAIDTCNAVPGWHVSAEDFFA
jgi:Uma2 family endonuclease